MEKVVRRFVAAATLLRFNPFTILSKERPATLCTSRAFGLLKSLYHSTYIALKLCEIRVCPRRKIASTAKGGY